MVLCVIIHLGFIRSIEKVEEGPGKGGTNSPPRIRQCWQDNLTKVYRL